VNGNDIQRRLEVLRVNLECLAEIPQETFEEFSADFRNLDSALHRLQTSIQALLDIGAVLVSRLGLLLSALEDWLRTPDQRSILMSQAGALADDESLEELLAQTYEARGRPEVDLEASGLRS
jgi:uncharacterized protein YutE (UPF0331/DUF86 family)